MSGVDHSGRPMRVLAAWGYESNASGERVEVDVWTVNPPGTEPESDAVERARAAFGARVARVIAAYGNVARVEYAGAAGEGYRYIDMSKTNPGKDKPSDATQQAFAGAKKSAGSERDARGRQTDGYTAPPGEPEIEQAINHGNREVIPVVKADARGSSLAERIGREPSRDEEGEPVETAPFDGFRNVVRYYTHGGVTRYYVSGASLKRGAPPWGEP